MQAAGGCAGGGDAGRGCTDAGRAGAIRPLPFRRAAADRALGGTGGDYRSREPALARSGRSLMAQSVLHQAGILLGVLVVLAMTVFHGRSAQFAIIFQLGEIKERHFRAGPAISSGR
jgi:hypothetical protein